MIDQDAVEKHEREEWENAIVQSEPEEEPDGDTENEN